MPLSQAGGGYQFGDGNLNETYMRAQGTPTTYTGATATLTVADISSNNIVVVGSGQSTSTNTLPSAASIDTALVNFRPSTAIDFQVINLGSGIATMAVPSGITNVGALTIAATSSGWFRLVRTSAVGATLAYVLYRVC